MVSSKATTVKQYLEELDGDRKDLVTKLYTTINKHISKGFESEMQYGMITWVVPRSIYPAGYHCKPFPPLPFISLANQKNFIALYHMALYAEPQLLAWFESEYKKTGLKLDMGKSCIRFKKAEHIPWKLIEQLVAKMTPAQWVGLYESKFKPKSKK